MDGKTILLLISVIAVGMFVLPTTLALYTGQHDFLAGNEVQCSKCHVLGGPVGTVGYEVNNNTQVHYEMSCGECHISPQAGAVMGGANGHAASLKINCIGCHSNSTYISATSGITRNVSAELENDASPHKWMGLNQTADATLNGGINDKDLVCVACHTRVLVNAYNISGTEDGTIKVDGGVGDGDWFYPGN